MNDESVLVNNEQCSAIAEILKNFRIRDEFYKRPFISFVSDRETKFRAYFFAVAICHQTHTLIDQKNNLHGWEFIEDVVSYLVSNNSDLLNPVKLADYSVDDLTYRMKPLFAEEHYPEKCCFDDIDERAELLIDYGRSLRNLYQGKASSLIDDSDSRLNGQEGLYSRLEKIKAFSDPLRKKSSFLIKLIADAGLLNIKDPENYTPVMDYHMQRVLLRMGCLDVKNKDLIESLTNRSEMETDLPVRQKSLEAMKKIATLSGHDLLMMNDFFWPLGRSCCNNDPLCQSGKCEKYPCSLEAIVEMDNHSNCIFESKCKGAKDPAYRNLWHPEVTTHYY